MLVVRRRHARRPAPPFARAGRCTLKRKSTQPARLPASVRHDDLHGHGVAPPAWPARPAVLKGWISPSLLRCPSGNSIEPVALQGRRLPHGGQRPARIALGVDDRAAQHAHGGRHRRDEARVARAGDEGRARAGSDIMVRLRMSTSDWWFITISTGRLRADRRRRARSARRPGAAGEAVPPAMIFMYRERYGARRDGRSQRGRPQPQVHQSGPEDAPGRPATSRTERTLRRLRRRARRSLRPAPRRHQHAQRARQRLDLEVGARPPGSIRRPSRRRAAGRSAGGTGGPRSCRPPASAAVRAAQQAHQHAPARPGRPRVAERRSRRAGRRARSAPGAILKPPPKTRPLAITSISRSRRPRPLAVRLHLDREAGERAELLERAVEVQQVAREPAHLPRVLDDRDVESEADARSGSAGPRSGPTSIARVRAVVDDARRRRRRPSAGMPSDLARSQPVPPGTRPSAAGCPDRRTPSPTLLQVPSPPTATILRKPLAIACSASSRLVARAAVVSACSTGDARPGQRFQHAAATRRAPRPLPGPGVEDHEDGLAQAARRSTRPSRA